MSGGIRIGVIAALSAVLAALGASGATARTASGNPFAGARFYLAPDSNAARTAAAWRARGHSADARALEKIAEHPQAIWFGDWNGPDPSADVRAAVGSARARGEISILVAYDIPGRDCGGYSAGGARSPAAYRHWVDGLARGIGSGPAAVILEPDAVPELDCMTPTNQRTTLALLGYAVRRVSTGGSAAVYLDAGNRGWQPPGIIATRLEQADVAQARGFSLNVSNFDWTSAEETYGDSISRLIGGKHFVVDTSRNGRGPAAAGAWCNPPGRGLGRPDTASTGDPRADALLWIKAPGESDGLCNGGPTAGVWWPQYALGLARRAAF